MQKAEMIAEINKIWDEFTGYLATLEPEYLTIPTDAAGWTAKDHVMHLAVWEDGVAAMLNKQSRSGQMGIEGALLASGDFDRINAVIQQQHRYLSWAAVMRHFESVHERMMQKLDSMSQEDLEKPAGHYRVAGKETNEGNPIYTYIIGDTFSHYASHRPWIEAIVAGGAQTDDQRQNMINRMHKAWDYLTGYLATRSEDELTEPTDAAGWTAKDHIMHLAVWEGGVVALLNKQPRAAAMGIDESVWQSHDYDQINAVIQQTYRDLSWAEVMRRFEDAHTRMMAKVESMTLEELSKPYGNYLPAGQEDNEGDPVYVRIAGNTFAHYPEHIEWIDAIVSSRD